MKFMRMSGLVLVAVSLLVYTLPVAASESAKREDGLHAQTWFKNLSFLNLRDDLADKKLANFIAKNFDVLQINMYGNKEVADMNGSVIDGRKYSEKVLIQFTPNTLFYGENGREIFRIPGYLQPKFYRGTFEYVLDRGPQRKILFPHWSRDKQRAVPASGGS